MRGHANEVYSLKYAPHSATKFKPENVLLSCSKDATIVMWNT